MKRVKGNKGAAGIDGMTVDEMEPWCTEHGRELVSDIWFGRHKPNPVRRKEIPKADGGVRKLGWYTNCHRQNGTAGNSTGTATDV